VRPRRPPPPSTIRSDFSLFGSTTAPPDAYGPPMKRRWPWIVALCLFAGIVLIVAMVLIGQGLQEQPAKPAARNLLSTPTLPPATPKPTIDRDLALREVMEVEQRWHQAWHDGNREVMRQVLAEEFRNVSPLGRVEGKVDFVENVRASPIEVTTTNASIIALKGNMITITLTKTYYYPGKESRSTLDTDTFVWRDDRWQLTYSQSSYKR
jgi:hypothetical protein